MNWIPLIASVDESRHVNAAAARSGLTKIPYSPRTACWRFACGESWPDVWVRRVVSREIRAQVRQMRFKSLAAPWKSFPFASSLCVFSRARRFNNCYPRPRAQNHGQVGVERIIPHPPPISPLQFLPDDLRAFAQRQQFAVRDGARQRRHAAVRAGIELVGVDELERLA